MERSDDNSENPVVRRWRHSAGAIINEHADGTKTATATPEALQEFADLHGVPVEIFAGYRATGPELEEIAEEWKWNQQASQMPEFPPDTVAKLRADVHDHLSDFRAPSWWDDKYARPVAESRLSSCHERMTELGGALPAGFCPVKIDGPAGVNRAVEVLETILTWCKAQAAEATNQPSAKKRRAFSDDERKELEDKARKFLRRKPKATREALAGHLQVSAGIVSNLNAWKQRSKSPAKRTPENPKQRSHSFPVEAASAAAPSGARQEDIDERIEIEELNDSIAREYDDPKGELSNLIAEQDADQRSDDAMAARAKYCRKNARHDGD